MTMQQSFHPHSDFCCVSSPPPPFCGIDLILACSSLGLVTLPCLWGSTTWWDQATWLGWGLAPASPVLWDNISPELVVFRPASVDVPIAFCIQGIYPKPLHENMMPITGTERSWMFLFLVLPSISPVRSLVLLCWLSPI